MFLIPVVTHKAICHGYLQITPGLIIFCHEAPDLEDDYCEYEDGELEEIAEEPEDEDTPPWEEDTEE